MKPLKVCFSDHSRIKVEKSTIERNLGDLQIFGNFKTHYKITHGSKMKSQGKLEIILSLKEYKNLWTAAKAMPRGKVIALNACIRKATGVKSTI